MSPKSAHAKHAAKSPVRQVGIFDSVLLIRLVVAAVIFAVALIVKMPTLVRIILLIVALAVAGYDIALEAVNSVEAGDYFATPLVIIVVAVLSVVIGYAAEGAALVLLYQCGLLLIAYVDDKTRKSALELVQYQDEETVSRVQELIGAKNAGTLEIGETIRRSAGRILMYAMIFALLYALLVPLFTTLTYRASIHRALMILIVCTPTSIVAAMPLTGIVGLCFSAQQGIVYNDAMTMEETADVNVAVFDKAGVFAEEFPRVLSVQSDVLDSKTMMNFVAHAVYYSEQPLAKAIGDAYNQDYKLDVISDFTDIPGSGVALKIGGNPVVLATAEYLAARGVRVPQDQIEEGQAFYLTVANRYVGRVVISADVNVEARELSEGMKAVGIKRCVLLTEDGPEESQRVAAALGFGEVFGECDTEKKLDVIGDLSHGSRSRVMYIYANGIEAHSAARVDARVSKKSKYADVLVLPDQAANLPFSVQICRRMLEIAKENAVFAFAVKAILIFLSIVGWCNIWFAIFIDVVATLFTMLNAIRVTTDSLLKK